MSDKTPDRGEAGRRGAQPDLHYDTLWLSRHVEDSLEPDLPIIDAHHHLWQRGEPYWVPELLQDLHCGHDIRGTIFVEAGAMYRKGVTPRVAPIGEVEYANGVGAAFASGLYGDVRACCGIVGKINLAEGATVREIIVAMIGRAPDRFRGVRHMTAFDPNPEISQLSVPPPRDLMLSDAFREGFAQLAEFGLTFDAYCYHPQLGQLIDLVDRFPDTNVVVDHCGALLGQGPYARCSREAFDSWRHSIARLAERPNVFIKIGGLAGRLTGHPFIDRDRPPSSSELAEAWRPQVETCLDAFGCERSMFESNFPPDKCGVSAGVLWNTFKKLAAGCSPDEKARLFSGTAIKVYRLSPDLVN